MDLFRCNSLSGWDPRSIQSILCRVSLQRVKALLFEISSGELSGNQKWLSLSEAPNVSPPWFSPRHRTAWLHLPSPREQAAAADNRDGSGCWRWAEQLTMPQLSQPLAARRLVAAGTKSPGCLHLLAPMEHSGADRAEAMPSAAGSASLPSSASRALEKFSSLPSGFSCTKSKQRCATSKVQRPEECSAGVQTICQGLDPPTAHTVPWLQTATSSSCHNPRKSWAASLLSPVRQTPKTARE